MSENIMFANVLRNARDSGLNIDVNFLEWITAYPEIADINVRNGILFITKKNGKIVDMTLPCFTPVFPGDE